MIITILLVSVFASFGLDRPEPAGGSAASNGDSADAASARGAEASSSGFSGGEEVVVEKSFDGHYYVEGRINGDSQMMLIDTGATTVAMGRAEAREAGLNLDESDFSEVGSTAGGYTRYAPVTIDRLEIGSIEATHVRAAVIDIPTLQPLLGQSFLGKLDEVTIRDDRLVMR